MPHLLVDLDNLADCQKGFQILRRKLGRGCDGGGRGRGGHRAGRNPATGGPTDVGRQDDWADDSFRGMAARGPEPGIADLPLPQKLKRIRNRGMWKHLAKIATSATEAHSLPELDSLLDLPKNKMRSLKAIMAKLENRFGIQFLKVDPDAGVDESGNPRYIMLPNVRRQILRLLQE